MVPLMFGVAGLSKHSIEKTITNRARAALEAQGITDVSVHTHGWGDVRLAGPASKQQAALAAVEAMAHRGDAHHITYAAQGSGDSASPVTTAVAVTTPPATTVAATTIAPPTTTVARTTTTVAPAGPFVDVTGTIDGKKIVLTGFVDSIATRTKLVEAATLVYGAGNVNDQLTVKSAVTTNVVDAMITQTANTFGLFGKDIASGTVHLVDTVLTVNGTGTSAEGAAEVNAAIAKASENGLRVSGSLAAPTAPAPPAAPDPAALQKSLNDLLALNPITFAYAKADISTESAATLDKAAAAILRVPGAKVDVAGYTDSTGNASGNKRLSRRRADAVRAYLVGKGVPDAQLTATGFGADNPIASNDTDEGRAANRRIAFIVGS